LEAEKEGSMASCKVRYGEEVVQASWVELQFRMQESSYARVARGPQIHGWRPKFFVPSPRPAPTIRTPNHVSLASSTLGRNSRLLFNSISRPSLLVLAVKRLRRENMDTPGTLEAIKYGKGKLQVLDQLQLPFIIHYDTVHTCEDAFATIKSMKVRGLSPTHPSFLISDLRV
jgi:hypothetical protein